MHLHDDLVNLQRFKPLALQQRLSDRFDFAPVRGNDALGFAQQALQIIEIDQPQRLREIVCTVLPRSE
jgi:hypothetical protein